MGEETRMSGTQARRQRNPRGQGERLREDIIEAATRLLEDPAAPPLSLRAVAREVGVEVPWDQMPGQKAWQHFVEGVAPCLARAPDDPEAARTALLLWQQLHGIVSLRISRPRFPWPPLAETITDAVTRLTTPATPRARGPRSRLLPQPDWRRHRR